MWRTDRWQPASLLWCTITITIVIIILTFTFLSLQGSKFNEPLFWNNAMSSSILQTQTAWQPDMFYGRLHTNDWLYGSNIYLQLMYHANERDTNTYKHSFDIFNFHLTKSTHKAFTEKTSSRCYMVALNPKPHSYKRSFSTTRPYLCFLSFDFILFILYLLQSLGWPCWSTTLENFSCTNQPQ